MKRLFSLAACVHIILFLLVATAFADGSNAAFNIGYESHLRGDLKGAIKHYTSAIEKNPVFAMAYQMRAAAWQQMKRYDLAINDFSMVISFGEPYFQSVGYFNRGVAKNMAGDYYGAIPDFNQTITLDKRMSAAYFHRGIAKKKTGDTFGQLQDFREAARLGEPNAEKWLNANYPGWKEMASGITPLFTP
ncbi:tetratricopeptide repeat protein [Chlorobium phaeobacteroides]|uniref:TPR repeat-containing protein n=1 Tax=Chlorobium phaeobacteroides (strain DSM 266 / SMG 266 / 2430) TaxID=290317 RepID=A1BJS6_CHLPD|nr:tetratricopeptide repeat protein [Chlorobium phaeobacteroides]ABL66653.1 TPR repeat-containing protein [Chlorobium phaeobacteroides DSM 266]